MPYQNLTCEIAERIATITLNRPKQLNALDRKSLEELGQAMAGLLEDAEVGVVILTGAGEKAFAAGADIAEMSALTAAEAEAYARLGQGVLAAIEASEKPVLAAVNGFALGGGCELAMAAALRVAADNAEFGQPEVNLGLIPGFAGTQRLSRLVGRAKALELILTGERIKAEEALRLGLVNQVVPAADLMAQTRKLAGKILGKAPKAIAWAMEALRRGADLPLAEGARLEAALFALCFATEDMREGTAAFLEKRPARFSGR